MTTRSRGLIWHTILRSATGGRGLAIILALGLSQSAQAQTYSVLYTFTGGADGANPRSSLVRSGGNLYGTTFAGGGAATGCAEDTGCGTVFELTKTGQLKVLYTFTGGNDGSNPTTGLVRDSAGNLYGTTDTAGQFAGGVAYIVPKTGGQTVLHAFKGGPSDVSPHISALTRDSAGNLYGTGEVGGTNGVGAVFEISGGSEKLLYSFLHGTNDGGAPWGGVIRSGAGNFYGTTQSGGSNGLGIVFKLSSSGTETVLYNFPGTPAPQLPYAGVIRDSAGNLYGPSYFGGALGDGAVYKLTKTGVETTLFSFNQSDGNQPYARLVRDSAGNLYGTTLGGGAFGLGTVFKIDIGGNETVLHSFAGGADGEVPYGGLILDTAGNLYGTTTNGGNSGCGSGCGLIFKIAP